MMESLMSSDATPFLILLVFGTGVFLSMMYYTRALRAPAPPKPAGPVKKKRGTVAAR
jgi:hypothetical protein